MAVKSFGFSRAKNQEAARQFLDDPAFAADLIGRRIAQDSDSPSDAVGQTNAVLRAVVTDLSAGFDRLQKGSNPIKDKILDIDRVVKQLKAQARKLEEVAAKIEELLPKMMAALGDPAKEPCNPTQQFIDVRVAGLARLVAEIEDLTASSIYPLPPDLQLLVSRFRPVLTAVPALYRYHVVHVPKP